MNRSRHVSKWLVVFAIVCGLSFAVQAQAESLTFASTRYIGSVTPGTPTSPDDEIDYINQLLSMALNTDTSVGGNDFDRSGFACAGCLPAVLTGSLTDLVTDDVPTALGAGFTYLYVKYSAGEGSHVWDIRGLTGTIGPSGSLSTHTFPVVAGQNEWSHFALFNPGTTTVPEPTTLFLLGVGLLSVGIGHRKLNS